MLFQRARCEREVADVGEAATADMKDRLEWIKDKQHALDLEDIMIEDKDGATNGRHENGGRRLTADEIHWNDNLILKERAS